MQRELGMGWEDGAAPSLGCIREDPALPAGKRSSGRLTPLLQEPGAHRGPSRGSLGDGGAGSALGQRVIPSHPSARRGRGLNIRSQTRCKGQEVKIAELCTPWFRSSQEVCVFLLEEEGLGSGTGSSPGPSGAAGWGGGQSGALLHSLEVFAMKFSSPPGPMGSSAPPEQWDAPLTPCPAAPRESNPAQTPRAMARPLGQCQCHRTGTIMESANYQK